MHLGRLEHAARRCLMGRNFQIWYHRDYRLPMSNLGVGRMFEPRRAEYTAWYLADAWLLDASIVRRPKPVRYREMSRVHSQAYLESLNDPTNLARIFASDAADIVPEQMLRTIRLATGGTVQAARSVMRWQKGAALNLFGGFHHAGPDRGGAFCAINDIAIAIADLRAHGCNGLVGVLDLDAHPPDGLAACFANDPSVWIGSLSSERWPEPLENVDETVLPRGCTDEPYLQAVRGLLARMPRVNVVFVIAGGDVVRGDPLGKLGLSWKGVRRRDALVLDAVKRIPSVWTPGGGYTPDAWRLLAGTAMVLSARSMRPIPERYEPMRARFSLLARRLTQDLLSGDESLDAADVEEALGIRPPRQRLLLDTYTTESIELALSRYGILRHIRRLGYDELQVEIANADLGEAVRVWGTAFGKRHKLVECVLERTKLDGRDVLYVHWLQLRNPRANFASSRPKLPGQDAPGLGLAHEVGWVLAQVARRVGMEGVAYRPAWYHTAYAGKKHFAFVDPQRQARFEALMRDTKHLPLVEVTRAAAEGRMCMNGRPYTWEADEMVFWLDDAGHAPELIAQLIRRYRFTVMSDERPPPPDCGKTGAHE